MNILLCESHYRSRSWIQALKDNKSLYLLSVLTEEYNLFIKMGFKKTKICNLNPKHLKLHHDTTEVIKYLKKFETDYSLNLNKYILMDRTLRTKKYSLTLQYAFEVIKSEIDFLTNNKIKLIFMEATWFHGVILCKIAEKMNIPVLVPVRDKILPETFHFFYGYNREKFY